MKEIKKGVQSYRVNKSRSRRTTRYKNIKSPPVYWIDLITLEKKKKEEEERKQLFKGQSVGGTIWSLDMFTSWGLGSLLWVAILHS